MGRGEQFEQAVSEDFSVGNRVISAVATKENTDPIELTPPLYDVIDPDALDSIVREGDTAVSVTFGYRDWQIDVRSNEITVTERRSEK